MFRMIRVLFGMISITSFRMNVIVMFGKCYTINKEKPAGVSQNSGGLSSVLRRNRGQAAQIVVLAAVGDGFQVFRFAPVGDADSCDLALLGHVHGLLFFDDGIVGKLIAGDPAALFDQADDALCVGVCLGDLVEGLLCEILSVHVRHSFGVVFAGAGRICAFTDGENCGIIQTNERGEWPCRKAITSRAGSWKFATS